MTANRYPWNQYPKTTPQHDGPRYRVCWLMSSAQAGCFGWRSETRSFATADEAIAAAKQNMGVAYKVDADVLEGNRWRSLYCRDRRKAKVTRRA